MADTPATTARCANCAKLQSDSGVNLKRCAKCQTTHYCSRACQKTNWKAHKKICASNAASAASRPSSVPAGTGNASPHTFSTLHDPNEGNNNARALAVDMDKPFHRLHAKTWLHDRPERDVFTLLIDTYRLRMEDDYKAGDVDDSSIYGGAADGRSGFRQFLRLAEKQPALLPSWWSREKATECIAFGLSGGWSTLDCAVEKSDIMEHYGSPVMPMQLRIFGEQVYKIGPWGQSGASMMQLQMQAEKRGAMTSFLSMG